MLHKYILANVACGGGKNNSPDLTIPCELIEEKKTNTHIPGKMPKT